ncbi:MAG: MinD/ParA family protein [Promethearchaeota archaeon]
MATITFNSYKGGTGKTLTSLNVAAYLAQQEINNKVALIDFDFFGPALFSVFKNPENRYINEAIYGDAEIEDVLIPFSHEKIASAGGELSVGIADPRPQTIQKINTLTDLDFKEAVGRTLDLQAVLEDDLVYDFIVIDTGPGLRRDVANAIYIADVVALVMKPTLSDLEGTKLVIEALIKGYATDKAVGIIFNRALNKNWQPHRSLSCADSDYQRIVNEATEFSIANEIQVFSWIPCMCDVSRSQADRILVLDYPEHPYTDSIQDCYSNILQAYASLE